MSNEEHRDDKIRNSHPELMTRMHGMGSWEGSSLRMATGFFASISCQLDEDDFIDC